MSKRIVVVGASRGIGRELVLLLSKNKEHHVYALSRNIEAMADLDAYENVTTGHIDLSDDLLHDQLQTLFNTLDRIDILINNAGKLVNKPFEELTRDDINQCYQTNAVGVMHATQFFVPKLKASGGHIVNISTVGAYQGSVKFPGLSAYSTSKAGVVSFTELFAEEYKETKIKMNCLCLGAVQTEMLEEAFPGYQAPISAEEMAAYIADFALNGDKYYNGKILQVSTSTP